jgi:hypothetical protein
MATITLGQFNNQICVQGLNTYNYTVKVAQSHFCKMRVVHQPGSTLTAHIQNNSVDLVTVTLVAQPDGPGQSSICIEAPVNSAINDVISFIISSSNAIDQQPNAVVAFLEIHGNMTN